MMTKLYYYLLGLMILLSVQSCKEDEINDPTNPQIQMEEQVEVFRGEGMQIQANVSHEMGIKSIRIQQSNWSLDKVINLEEEGSPKEYALNYFFAVPSESDASVSIEVTATSVGGNTTTAQQQVAVKESESIYLMAHNLEGRESNWGDPSSAIRMDRTEDNPNEYTTIVTFMGNGGADDWGSVLAIIGQSTGVVPFNAVVDYDKVSSDHHDTAWWWNGNNYEEGSNYPGYVIFDEASGSMEFDMITQEDATVPVVEEPGFYNLHPLAFYNNPGKYEVKFNKETMKLTLTMTDAPEPPVEADMYIVGHGYPEYSQNWNPADGIPMTTLEEGIYTKKNIQIDAGGEMKFVGQKDWSPDNFGWTTKGSDPSVTMKNGDDSNPLVFDEAGYYDIVFNKNNLTCTVEKVGDVAPPEITLPENLYLISGGIEGLNDGSWYEPSAETVTDAHMLSNQGNGIFEGTFTLKADDGNGYGVYFKFIGQVEGYNPLNYGLQGVESPTGNDVWALTPPVEIDNEADYYAVDNTPYASYTDMAGEYNIKVDFYAQTVTIEKQIVADMYIVGNGYTDYDQNWDPSNGIPMVTIEEGVYQYENLNIEAGAEMKFVGQKDWSPDNFGWETKGSDPSVTMLNGDSSQPLVFDEAGTYTITFNKNDLTCTVTKVQ